MGYEETIRGLSSVVWPGQPGPDSAKPRSAEGRFRAFNPTAAQTPKEALTYIERLHKAGRMEDLAALLRQSPVFREAWLTLQQSPSAGSEASGGPPASYSPPGETPGPGDAPLSAPEAGPPGPLPKPGPGLARLKEDANAEFSREIPAASINSTDQNCPVPSPRPTRPLPAARQIYESQQRYYTQGKDPQPRISVKV